MYHIYTLKRLTFFEVDLQKKEVAKREEGLRWKESLSQQDGGSQFENWTQFKTVNVTPEIQVLYLTLRYLHVHSTWPSVS